jgi:hypothetical protein
MWHAATGQLMRLCDWDEWHIYMGRATLLLLSQMNHNNLDNPLPFKIALVMLNILLLLRVVLFLRLPLVWFKAFVNPPRKPFCKQGWLNWRLVSAAQNVRYLIRVTWKIEFYVRKLCWRRFAIRLSWMPNDVIMDELLDDLNELNEVMAIIDALFDSLNDVMATDLIA